MSISFGTTIINQTMWLNPHTNILHDSANHIDCALDDQVPVVLNGKLNVYHHTTGDVTIASGIDKINLFAFDYSDLGHDLNQPVIHKLLLYDWHLFRDKFTLRLLDTNFESLENLMMLYIVRKVLASLVEFSNFDDVASFVTQQHLIFITKRVVAKTAVDRVW